MNKKTQQQQPQLETVEEQFDDFEKMPKDMSLQDIETMQIKLGVELVKDQVKEYLGVADARLYCLRKNSNYKIKNMKYFNSSLMSLKRIKMMTDQI